MAELQDDDLMLVNKTGQSFKATGADIKDSLGPSDYPPNISSILLTQSGSGFSGETFTTVLPDYNTGQPPAMRK